MNITFIHTTDPHLKGFVWDKKLKTNDVQSGCVYDIQKEKEKTQDSGEHVQFSATNGVSYILGRIYMRTVENNKFEIKMTIYQHLPSAVLL